MLTLDTLTEFLGWCLVINIGFYLLIVVSLMFLRKVTYTLSARIFDVSHDDAKRETLAYVANYKLAINVLFLAPYIALKIMA